MNTKRYVVVIGAANIDIGGTPYKPLIHEDSNPGIINMSFGGVGRNIAHNLAVLGIDVKLVTAIGGDVLGRDIINQCNKLGIDTSLSVIVPEKTSSVYLYINDEKGEMDLALSHVDIVKNITPEYIESIIDDINSAALVVADCNLSQETLLKIMDICEVPLYVDTVSVSHADKIKGHLHGIDTIKPNHLEAEYLTDMIIDNEYDCIEAANAIIDQGVKRVFISVGQYGMLATDGSRSIIADRYPTHVKSTTGAGDSAMAAIIWSSLNNYTDLENAAKAANCAASLTISVNDTNHKKLNTDTLIKMMNDGIIKIRDIEEFKGEIE